MVLETVLEAKAWRNLEWHPHPSHLPPAHLRQGNRVPGDAILKIVLANGCFDPLHFGHILHLRAAREMGDVLIVALTSDEAVKREKGHQTFYPWSHRAEILRELSCVDKVVKSESGLQAIRDIHPQVFVKGVDYAKTGVDPEVEDLCQELGVKIEYTGTPKFSSRTFLQKMMAANIHA